MNGTSRASAITQNGDVIREIRKREGLTVDALANLTSISGPHLRNLENEHRSASVEHLSRIARALNVPLRTLRRDAAA